MFSIPLMEIARVLFLIIIAVIMLALFLCAFSLNNKKTRTIIESCANRLFHHSFRDLLIYFLFLSFRGGAIMITVAVYQTILALAPDMLRYLTEHLPTGQLSLAGDFMPPLIFLTSLAIPALLLMKFLEYPFLDFKKVFNDTKEIKIEHPIEDTGDGMEY